MMGIIRAIIFFCAFFIVSPLVFLKSVFADSSYLTIISLVRSSSEWVNHDKNWLEAQHNLIVEKKYVATWLVDYDAIGEFSEELKTFESSQEIGLLLEITPRLASELNLPYDYLVSRYQPQNVFLSGYSQDQKKKIIDRVFWAYFEKFGYWPKSIGAWFIDSWSLAYMRSTYGVDTALIVAEQYQTDNHTVRGHPWQIAYFPSDNNVLLPAVDLLHKQDLVVIQWAARHPFKGWGEGLYYSNFSVQANDYTKHGFGEEYFTKLVRGYLFNPFSDFNQLTIGIEVGQEGAEYFQEFSEQLATLGDLGDLQIVTTSQFGQAFRKRFPEFSENNIVSWQDENDPYQWAVWFSGRHYRMGLIADKNGVFMRDLRVYGPFQDDLYFDADRRNALFRQTEAIIDEVGLGKRWQILGEGTNTLAVEKAGNGFLVVFGDKAISLSDETFRFNFAPKEAIDLPENLSKMEDGGLWVFKPSETGLKASNADSWQIALYIMSGAWILAFLKSRRFRGELIALAIGILAVGFLSLEVYSLLPIADLGFSYFAKLHPLSVFAGGVLAYLIAPLLYVGLGVAIFSQVRRLTKSVLMGILSATLFFFYGSLGFILVFYRQLPLDAGLVSGIKSSAFNFIWFFKFPSLEKLFFAFSAGQMNIEFFANAAKTWNLSLIPAAIFFQFMNFGVLFLGVIFLLWQFWTKRKTVKFILLLALMFWAPFAVNRVDLRLSTAADTILGVVGIIGLFLLVKSLKKSFRLAGIILILAAFFAAVVNFESLAKRNSQIWFRFNSDWYDKGKTATILGRQQYISDVFLWQVFNQTGSAVFIPQGIGQYFFVDVNKSNLDLAAENSYGVIGRIRD